MNDKGISVRQVQKKEENQEEEGAGDKEFHKSLTHIIFKRKQEMWDLEEIWMGRRMNHR